MYEGRDEITWRQGFALKYFIPPPKMGESKTSMEKS